MRSNLSKNVAMQRAESFMLSRGLDKAIPISIRLPILG